MYGMRGASFRKIFLLAFFPFSLSVLSPVWRRARPQKAPPSFLADIKQWRKLKFEKLCAILAQKYLTSHEISQPVCLLAKGDEENESRLNRRNSREIKNRAEMAELSCRRNKDKSLEFAMSF